MPKLVASAILAFFLDQFSKYWVIHVLGVSAFKSMDIYPPYLRFIYGENRGINFGLAGDVPVWVLISIALAICVIVVIWIARTSQRRLAYISAGFLVGGALGNVFDRLVFGYVIDFLNMSCCGFVNPYVFNIADIFVFAGALGLAFFATDSSGPKSKKPVKKRPSKKGT